MTVRKGGVVSRKQRSSNSPTSGAALDFMSALWALDHALRSRSKGMSREVGVTGPQRLVLRLAGKAPGISAGELAEALHVHPSTLTGVLARLGKRRLLVRRRDPRDARRAVLHLTERGLRIDKMRTGTVEAAVLRVLSSLDERDVAAARRVLALLVRELEKG
jgi:DNA-binding MarR family transcriptional regulator